jgi:hypothetical protein
MLKSSCPITACHLTDAYGNIISPYKPNSIRYGVLTGTQSGNAASGFISVSAQGFVAVCTGGKNLSAPIPFCIIQRVSVYAPRNSVLSFRVNRFRCCAVPIFTEEKGPTDRIRISIQMETIADSKAAVTLMVPEADKSCSVKNTVCIRADRIYDSVCFDSKICFTWQPARLLADVCHYNALSDGKKRIYTDDDGLKEYGGCGIPSPDDISFYNLFINGVLQPQKDYYIKKGLLELLSENVPMKDQTIIFVFVTFKDSQNRRMDVTDNQYMAVARAGKKVYTDADGLTEYGSKGIPSPNSVSYYNLYINGLLQPQNTYTVERGILRLAGSVTPPTGALITLESVVIKDTLGQLFRSDTYQYNAFSNGTRFYTNSDELPMYGKEGILDPSRSAYQNLFVNGVIQPEVNYTVYEGCLVFNTTDAPIPGAAISLQYVGERPKHPCGEYSISDKAYCKWADRFLGFKTFESKTPPDCKQKQTELC